MASKTPAITTAGVIVDEIWHYRHDMINICLIPFVVAINILYLSQTNDVFLGNVQYIVFSFYMIFDTLFIILIPNCVASPTSIIIHHLIVLFGWLLMLIDSTWYSWISLGMLVEINTWFHVARRNWRKSVILQIFFFISWFLLRNVLYPAVLYLFVFEYVNYSTKLHRYLNNGLLILLLICFLNIMNIKWTYDLLAKKVKINGFSLVFDEKNDKGM